MGWHHDDLTAAAGAPLPAVDQSMSAYAFEDQGTQHVIYVRQDSHIEELWWDNSGWHHNDLTAAASAPLPAVDQGIAAYAFEDQGTQQAPMPSRTKAASMSSTSGRTFMLKSSGGTAVAGIITTLRPRLARRYQPSIKA